MGRENRRKTNPTVSGNFTDSADLQNRFFMKGEERRKKGDKASGDSGYWNGGRCQWGGSHNLQEDCEALAKFFNDTNSIADDVSEIKLSANETAFNQKKQILINKIQGLISKCQTSNSYSIANICCIWSDYFGSFLKPFLNTFSNKLQRQLGEVQNLEPKHQKELLQLEKEAQELQSAYDENMKKANDPNISPEDKTKFLLLANEVANKAKHLKSKIKQNPLADLSRFSNLDDLTTLLGGNVPKKPPSSNKPNSQNTSDSSNNNSNPTSNNSDWLQENKQLLIIAGATLIVIFYLYTQKEETETPTNLYHYNF